jgi:hypothetical protein
VDGDTRGRHRSVGVALSLLALAIAATWPLGRIWRPELPSLPDASFNVWRLAWVAHQLATDPSHLFEANIFTPAAHTLAYSDAMLLLGVIGAPFIWLGVHPYLVHNVLVVAAFWTASYGTYLLCLRLTSSPWAAVIGGLVSGYAPYRFSHSAHLELLWTAFLPLGLLALVRLFEQPGLMAAIRLALFVVLQTLCSIYYGIYFSLYLAIASIGLALRGDRDRMARVAFALFAAAGIATLTLLPYGLIYREARASIGDRTRDEIARYSAAPGDYLHVSHEHALPLPRAADIAEERSLYPGAVAVLLAIVGVAGAPIATAPFAGLLVVSVDLSLGTNGLLYSRLLEALPPLASLRAPARFGALVILSLSILSAIGAARLLARSRFPQRLGCVLAGLMLIEYWAAPLATRREPLRPPAVYAWLAEQPRSTVVELPLPVPEALWEQETEYQLMSIYHWQRLANGYSGNAPRAYVEFLNEMRAFPDDTSLRALNARGVRWIVIHEGLFDHRAFTSLMEHVVRSQALRSLGTYADQWGQATILEIATTTL